MSSPVLAVIPARIGSVRLPRKPLRSLAGVPLVVRVFERVSSIPGIDRVVVATDSPEVEGVVSAAGGESVLTATTHPSGTDRIAEVVRGPDFSDYEVVVNVQGDEPAIDGGHVIPPLEMVRQGTCEIATSAAPLTDAAQWQDPSVVKVARAASGRALYFSRAPIPHPRDEPFAPGDSRWLHHVGVYVYTRAALLRWVVLPPSPLENTERLEQLRPLEAGFPIGVAVVPDAPNGIDTEEDLAREQSLWTDEGSRRAHPAPTSPATPSQSR